MTQTEASYRHELHHREHCLTPLLFVKFAKKIYPDEELKSTYM